MTSTPSATQSDRKKVAQFESVIEAEAAKSLLESQGIPCAIQNEFLGNILPYATGAIGGISLSVDSADEIHARRLLTEIAKPDSDAEPETAPDAGIDLTAPTLSPQSAEAEFNSLIRRATYGALMGALIFPVIANFFSLSLYIKAYRLDPNAFRKKWGMVLMGLVFNIMGLILMPMMFIRALLPN